ncbi:MAG: hypothetical protein GQ527_07795 [Bacteroidales bacterium]|nr:hypothetical protein [Bacteroidales bacterium]
MKKIIFFLVFSMWSFSSFSQDTLLKALYVNDFVDIIDIPSAEDELLNYAQDHHFNFLIIYNITKIHRNRFPLDNEMTDDPFASFIKKAKTQYGIKRISVVGEKATSFDPILKYNLNHLDDEDELVDGFNLEFEFWNSRLTGHEKYYCKTYFDKMGLPCNRAGAFYFYMEQLKILRTVASEFNIKLESYVGVVSKEEMQTLIQYLNTIHIHYYRKNTKNIASYKSNRINGIIDGKSKVEVFPIFSASEKHMKDWLQTHDIDEVFPIFMEQIKKDKSLYPIINNIKGQSWYRYTDMPK